MMRNLIAILVVFLTTMPLMAQDNNTKSLRREKARTMSKLDARARQQFTNNDKVISAIIDAEDGDSILDRLQEHCVSLKKLPNGKILARIKTDSLEKVNNIKGVKKIRGSRKMKLRMDSVRSDVNANEAHEGYNLDSPFTGKGVIIADIDEGFQYDHPAFLDSAGNSRILWTWDRSGYNDGIVTYPTTEIPSGTDSYTSYEVSGHGTHVTGIAAGSKTGSSKYYGIAPEADIVMVSSPLDNSEILEDVDYIFHYADSVGKPCIINMSFGEYTRGRDGKDDYFLSIDDAILENKGRMVTMAAGNEADYVFHTAHTFTSNEDTVRALFSRPSSNYGYINEIDMWCRTADGAKHFYYEPFIYNTKSQSTKELSSDKKERYLEEDDGIDEYNSRQYYYLAVTDDDIFSSSSDDRHSGPGSSSTSSSSRNNVLGIKLWGDLGYTIDIWGTPDYSEDEIFIEGPDDTYLSGDADYTLCNNSNEALVVTAHNTKNKWKSLSGESYTDNNFPIGEHTYWAGMGPSFAENPKPDVSAPGCYVVAAIQNYDNFSEYASTTVDKVTYNGKKYYYEAMSGTSMASPVVCGAVAIWLQANPDLTAAQIRYIVANTSTHDDFTGYDTWNKTFGYGKINVYEGLKAALNIETGIVNVYDTEKPVTFSKDGSNWKILFNSSQNEATIAVYTINGTMIQSIDMNDVKKGYEYNLNLDSFPHGTVILSVKTRGDVITRKITI